MLSEISCFQFVFLLTARVSTEVQKYVFLVSNCLELAFCCYLSLFILCDGAQHHRRTDTFIEGDALPECCNVAFYSTFPYSVVP